MPDSAGPSAASCASRSRTATQLPRSSAPTTPRQVVVSSDEASVGRFEDLYLYTIDDLQAVVDGNLSARQDEAREARVLIAEEVATSKDPEQLSMTLDGAVKSIQGANRWMVDNSELFTSMEAAAPPADLIGGARQGQAQKQ